MPNEGEAFRTNSALPTLPVGTRAIWRFHVRARVTDPAPPAGTYLVFARTWDGAAEGPKDYIVRTFTDRAAGEEFFATIPEGGSGATYGAPPKPVHWMEVAGGGIKIRYAKAVAALAAPALTITATPVVDALGNPFVPAKADIEIYLTGNLTKSHYWLASVAANDVIAYVPLDPSAPDGNGVAFGMPIVGTVNVTGALAQSLGANGAMGIDWLRAHSYDPIP